MYILICFKALQLKFSKKCFVFLILIDSTVKCLYCPVIGKPQRIAVPDENYRIFLYYQD